MSTPLYLNAKMNWKNAEHMMNEFKKSNTARFLHLFFSASGGMGPTATIVYKRLASLLAEKYDKPYCQTIHWLRCHLNFSLLHSAITCIQGSRSMAPNTDFSLGDTTALACSRARVDIEHV